MTLYLRSFATGIGRKAFPEIFLHQFYGTYIQRYFETRPSDIAATSVNEGIGRCFPGKGCVHPHKNDPFSHNHGSVRKNYPKSKLGGDFKDFFMFTPKIEGR